MLAISPPQIFEEGFLTVLWVKGAPAVLKVHSSLISRVLSGSLVRHLNETLKNKRVPGKTSMLALDELFEAQKGSRWNPRKGLRWLQMNPFQPKKGRYSTAIWSREELHMIRSGIQGGSWMEPSRGFSVGLVVSRARLHLKWNPWTIIGLLEELLQMMDTSRVPGGRPVGRTNHRCVNNTVPILLFVSRKLNKFYRKKKIQIAALALTTLHLSWGQRRKDFSDNVGTFRSFPVLVLSR